MSLLAVKVVIDCNVLISAALNSDNCQKVLFAVIADHQLILSKEILHEYVTVSQREKFFRVQHRLTQLIKIVSARAVFFTPIKSSIVLVDPKDQIYLDTALAAQADVLVTGNKKHFASAESSSVRILSPKEFLEWLAAHSSE